MSLLVVADVGIVEKAASNMLCFIQFSMLKGIEKPPELVISDEQLEQILPAIKLDKMIISKSLLKSVCWAMNLPASKRILCDPPADALKPSAANNKKLAAMAEPLVTSDDKGLSNAAREVLKICRSSAP